MTLAWYGNKEVNLLTSSGAPIKNGQQFSKLLQGPQQPKQLMIIKIPGHSKYIAVEERGNQLADIAAQQVALNDKVIQTYKCVSIPEDTLKETCHR